MGGMIKSWSARLRAFPTAVGGMSSVEFAFILPVFIAFMMGSAIIFDGARALRQVSTAAATVSDLATRLETMDDGMRDSIFTTAEALMGSYADNSVYNIIITSVANELGDGVDTLEVVWSEAKIAGTARNDADLGNYSFPEIPDGESLVMVEIDLTYTPVFNAKGMASSILLDEVAMRRPRFVNEVCYEISEVQQTCSSNN